MRTAALAVALLAVACQQARADVTSLTLQVEPKVEECFFEDIQAGEEIEALALVYRGGKLDIKLRVEGPDKSILYEKLLFSNIDDSTGGMLSTIVKKGYRFRAASTGLYTICLDNRMSRWTAKVAVFDLNRKSPEAAKPATGDSLGEHVVSDVLSSAEKDALMGASLMRAACNRIYAKLGQIENSQMYHYHRERRHRNTLEDTNSRVQWWTLAETLIIVVVALGQTVIVRKWFAVKETLPGGRASYDA